MTAIGTKQLPWTNDEISTLRGNYQEMSARQLLDVLPNRSWESIRGKVRTLGLKKETRVVLACDYCRNEIVKRRYEHRRHDLHFCDNDCKHAYFVREQNPAWQGGVTEQSGYKMLRTELGAKAPYTREHRVVAEKMLGRTLLSDEVVHHINGDRSDNRPENLQVMTRSEHSRHHWEQGDFANRSKGGASVA